MMIAEEVAEESATEFGAEELNCLKWARIDLPYLEEDDGREEG